MKKIIALLLTLTTVVTLASCAGGNGDQTDESTKGGPKKTDSADVGGQIPGKTDPADVPHDIPDSEGLAYELNEAKDGYIVVGIGECTDTKIGIPATHAGLPVTKIGDAAFQDCTGLTSITIPNGVTVIGYSAFFDCIGLTSITIPDSVTRIDGGAFCGCTGLTSITVAEENPVFHSAGNCLIETESRTMIAGCKASVIPSDGSVTKIGNYAFAHYDNLTSITIPDGVTSIGIFTFATCTGLTSITIPSSVTSINTYAFSRCDSLTDIYYAGTEAQWAELAEEADVPETATVHFNSQG